MLSKPLQKESCHPMNVQQRKRSYRFLASAFSYPTPELVQTLPAEMAEIASRLGIDGADGEAAAAPQALEEAYTRLFIARLGGVPAPPYGSVYLDDGTLMGPSTQQVLACYEAAGLAFEATGEPPDFLATELEFLYYLVGQEEQALARRDLAAAKTQTRRQREFLERWLQSWLEPFAARVAADGEAGLYGRLVELLVRFVEREVDWLKRLPESS